MGLSVEDFQNVIMVKENGLRFYDETKSGYDFFAACLAWSGDPQLRQNLAAGPASAPQEGQPRSSLTPQASQKAAPSSAGA